MENILVLGGTSFIGRKLAEQLISNVNYQITLFNRGKTNPNLFKDVNLLVGDRNTVDVQQIAQKKWDYVIDVSCYYPDSLRSVLSNLVSLPKRYIYISTVSAYDNEVNQEILRKESAPLLNCTSEQEADTTLNSYGNRKAACERILEESELSYSILRPALVYGPYDPTDRFYYWLYQVKRNPSLLLPKGGVQHFSTTYVNDLVQGILNLITESKREKVYDAISLPQTTITAIVDLATVQLNTQPSKIALQADFLKQENIQQWVDIPLWLDDDFHTYNNDAFLKLIERPATPLSEAIKESVQYFNSIDWPTPQFGISETRRKKLLERVS